MKPEPAPEVPGNTPWEKLNNAVRTVFGVSKEAVLKEEAKQKRQREKTRTKKNGHNDARRPKRPHGSDSVT